MVGVEGNSLGDHLEGLVIDRDKERGTPHVESRHESARTHNGWTRNNVVVGRHDDGLPARRLESPVECSASIAVGLDENKHRARGDRSFLAVVTSISFRNRSTAGGVERSQIHAEAVPSSMISTLRPWPHQRQSTDSTV